MLENVMSWGISFTVGTNVFWLTNPFLGIHLKEIIKDITDINTSDIYSRENWEKVGNSVIGIHCMKFCVPPNGICI